MKPFGGPYWSTGRAATGCFCTVCGCCFPAADVCCLGSFDALTAYMVASTMCGSMVMVTMPTLVMLSLGGFLGSSCRTPLRL